MTDNNSNDGKPAAQKTSNASQGRLKKEVLDAIDEEDKDLIKQTLGFFRHKTGWIGQEEENLPATIQPSSSGKQTPPLAGNENHLLETKQEGVGDKIIGHGKRALSRALFHVKAWGTGILAGVLTGFAPSALSVSGPVTAMLSIFGMFLLFPFHINRSATLMGIIVGVLSIAAGYWPLAIVFGGLATALIHILNRRSVPLAFFFLVPVILLTLSATVGTAALAAMPLWFYGGTGASVLLGIVRPRWLTKLAGKLFEFSDKKTIEDDSARVVEIVEIEDEFKDFPEHLKELEKMRGQTNRLPEDMAQVVGEMKLKARAILKCMVEDPRDVMPGNQFLNRYLPMLNTTIEQFATIAQYNSNSVEFERAKEHTLRVLADMNDAFGQAHQRLVDNDVDDLLVNLKVLDRLRKSDGYDQK